MRYRERALRIAVSGAAGRMGRLIARLVANEDGMVLAASLERAGHPALGEEVEGARLTDNLRAALDDADVLVDFTAPDGAVAAARACAARRVAAVIGTTGLDDAQRAAVAEAAGRTPIVFAANMSLGVNVAYRLVAEARRLLGDRYTPAVFEAHHRHKKDAPSGTAVRLAEVAGAPRGSIAAVRGGDVVGEHTVFFLGDGERIELTHRATSREAFARGAVRAAAWVAGKPPRLYDMADVLGLT